MPDPVMKHICEVCGRTEVLSSSEAFHAGWDYPPLMGTYGVVSPRTCPDCSIMDTVWAALALRNVHPKDLTDAQKTVLNRILTEHESILPDPDEL